MTNITITIIQSMCVVLNRRSASPWHHPRQVSGHELVGNENGNLHRKRFLVLAGSFNLAWDKQCGRRRGQPLHGGSGSSLKTARTP
jgi:hypothetical protein